MTLVGKRKRMMRKFEEEFFRWRVINEALKMEAPTAPTEEQRKVIASDWLYAMRDVSKTAYAIHVFDQKHPEASTPAEAARVKETLDAFNGMASALTGVQPGKVH